MRENLSSLPFETPIGLEALILDVQEQDTHLYLELRLFPGKK